MAGKKPKYEYVMVCPQCKSTDIRQDKSTIQSLGYVPQMYICNRCGHSGYAFPEIEISQLKKFEEDIHTSGLSDTSKDQTPLMDISYGKFIVRGAWKIFAPIVIIIGISLMLLDEGPSFIYGAISLLIGLFMALFAYRPISKKAP